MDEHERRAAVLEAVEGLRALGPGWCVIVEGVKDERSLRILGVTCPVVRVKDGRNLVEVADDVMSAYRGAVILTDWDRTGGRIAHRLKELFTAGGISTDFDTRMELSILTSKEVRTVEGLLKYYRRSAADREALELHNRRRKG